MKMVIVDPVTPHAYDASSLRNRPLGGTEATVIRIAEAMDAIVLQHNRVDNGGRYRSLASAVDPDCLVVLREPIAALEMAERFPRARKWLWLHDLAGPGTDRGKKLLAHAARLAAQQVSLVCVSDFHAADVSASLAALPVLQRPRVIRVYNPVDLSPLSDATLMTDVNKLVFFSSPHKGLDYALAVFSHLYRQNRDLRLYIANPGYLPGTTTALPGVINLGAIPHHEILRHVGTALCTFYPNYVYPETFGLALAESNGLGVPVLTHGIGAAAEVLNGPGQLIDVPRVRGVADSLFWRLPSLRHAGEAALGLIGTSEGYRRRIGSWQRPGGRPLVQGRVEFSLPSVVAAWRAANALDDAP